MADELSDLRDRLAGLLGWKMHEVGYWYNGNEYLSDGTPKNGQLRWEHPVGDLTALAAAWPEGWDLCVRRFAGGWRVGANLLGNDSSYIQISYFDTEYEARLQLTIAVLEQELRRD